MTDDWKSIESAPKDGTYILAWCESWGCYCVVYWTKCVWVTDGAWIAEENRTDTIEYPATHWKPLDVPPSPIGGTGA